MNRWQKAIVLFIAFVLAGNVLTGCSNNNEADVSNTPFVVEEATTPMPTVDVEVTLSNAPGTVTDEGDVIHVTSSPVPLTAKQSNSINILNYLVVFTQEVNNSKNSRLFLEEAYSSLYNNSHPNAIDARTQAEINTLFNTIESYRMITVKRDRLQYIYEQNRAQALRDAVPNPLGLISAVQSFSIGKLVASVVYMAVDSVTSYQSSTAQADMQYLQDGWALSDEQATTLHNMRKGTFNYMVETVRDYELPGELALTEEAVADYVERKGYSNNLQKIQLFEDSINTYRAFGPYWLTLAECYYSNGDYGKCLEAISQYEALDLKIFRRDYDYANILPLAIVALEHTLSDTEYITAADRYASSIVSNTSNKEWALRYFAAQTYIGLYGKTGNTKFLTSAYDITVNNVSFLLTEQKSHNAEYLADVQQAVTPKGATDAQKKDILQHNKSLVEERKTALPPVYEPLLINCDLLMALARQLSIPDEEATRLNGILHENGEPLFLAIPLDQSYWLDTVADIDPTTIATTYTNAEFSLPARYVSLDAKIIVTVSQGDQKTIVDDWKISKVERKDKADIASFIVSYTSGTAQKLKYAPNALIEISVLPYNLSTAKPLVFNYRTIAAKTWVVIDTVLFQRIDDQ